MSRFAILAAAAMISGCGAIPTGGGGGADPTSTYKVYDNNCAHYDVAALKEGDWVEYEAKSSAGGGVSKTRTACVKVDSLVWIETAVAGYEGWYLLVGVDKADRKVKKAYMGEKDKEAKELKVEPAPTAAAGGNTDYKVRGTGKVSRESVTVKGTAYDCEKIDTNSTTTVSGKDYASKSTTWVSEKVPFRYYVDEKANAAAMNNADYKWEGKPSVKGGYVKMTSESSGMTSEMNLVGCGTDAKMTVKLPAPK